jgi:hypothetical protein
MCIESYAAITGRYFSFTPYERWARSWCSPVNRGLLWRDRIEHAHMARYKHTPVHLLDGWWYRHPRTQNERRQVAASQVDAFAPSIRGRRNATNLPCAWDDIGAHRARSWKQKKVKKQWMANLR